jgi:hypothetical protein
MVFFNDGPITLILVLDSIDAILSTEQCLLNDSNPKLVLE